MINLDNLAALHDDEKAIHRHKRILEELFYLCINETFVDTIGEARIIIERMILDVDLSFPCTSEAALTLRNERLAMNPDYQQLLSQISDSHRYYHPSFTRNFRRIGTDNTTHDHFNVLENILFFNDPIPGRDPLNHFNNRSGFMEIADDEITGPHIRIQFDLGTSKGEMINIIEKDFPETKELLTERYNFPAKQYRADESLTIKKFIYQHSHNDESDMDIAIRLEDARLLSSEVTEDHVRKYRERMKADTDRFGVED